MGDLVLLPDGTVFLCNGAQLGDLLTSCLFNANCGSLLLQVYSSCDHAPCGKAVTVLPYCTGSLESRFSANASVHCCVIIYYPWIFLCGVDTCDLSPGYSSILNVKIHA